MKMLALVALLLLAGCASPDHHGDDELCGTLRGWDIRQAFDCPYDPCANVERNPISCKDCLMTKLAALVAKHGGVRAAARAADLPYETFRDRLKREKHQPATAKPVTHCVIPDVQAKPGVPLDHLRWAGQYIAKKRPDVIVCIGDFADMPSLSSYDKGKRSAENRRYRHDIAAAHEAMELLMAPIVKAKDYKPRLVMTLGNHEHRIVRYTDDLPELHGQIGLKDLGYEAWGWEVYPFLEVVKIDGIEYSHYFTSGAMGRPASSSAVLLRERQCSCTQGHVQTYEMAIHKRTQNRALMAGCFYQHDEDYLGPQGNGYRRHIIFKHEVNDGHYDIMEVSLDYLRRTYG
ncbi:MAG: metallophosphoesterase [Burkholderiales bacterium]|nr:metallophosphoesterase [Burkholderiales bacterium]